MTTSGGGWMLYLDFGSSAARSALVANGIDTLSELDAHTYTRFTSNMNASSSTSQQEYRIDEYRADWVNFHHWGAAEGHIGIFAPAGYTNMRVDYGNGYWFHKNVTSFVVVNVNGKTKSKTHQPSVRGSIAKKSAVFGINGGEKITVSEAASVNYLDAVWVK